MTHKKVFYANIYYKHQFLRRGRAEGLTDGEVINERIKGRMDGPTDRLTDRRKEKETGIGTNEDEWTDFPYGRFYDLI